MFEPTTISAAARAIAETLEKNYAIDPLPIFADLGMDPERMKVAGARYPWAKMQQLWLAAKKATGDECFGLVVGQHIRPTTFHALGFSWLASRTLLESLQRYCRYSGMISNAPIDVELKQQDDQWILAEDTGDKGDPKAAELAVDAFIVGIIKLCRQARDEHVKASAVYLTRPTTDRLGDYVEIIGAPVTMGHPFNAIAFDRDTLEAPLPGDNLELAIANDRISEEYIAALNPQQVSSEVRKLLIELLPSGDANQETIAGQMNRSLSTLQRQLAAEGTNYKDIRDNTRRNLAEQYVREGEYTLSQVAYLLGFSDQSNFSRAFRRWTGQSPGSYTKH